MGAVLETAISPGSPATFSSGLEESSRKTLEETGNSNSPSGMEAEILNSSSAMTPEESQCPGIAERVTNNLDLYSSSGLGSTLASHLSPSILADPWKKDTCLDENSISEVTSVIFISGSAVSIRTRELTFFPPGLTVMVFPPRSTWTFCP